MEYEAVQKSIVSFVRTEIQKRGANNAIIGVSGGIDSAVMTVLATEALGNKNVFGLILPDADVTPIADVRDALDLCNKLKIEYRQIDINEVKSSFLTHLDASDNKLIQGNLSARIRMCILYYYSGLLKGLVLGTSNKTEIELGYFTKYGDGGADLLPLGDLYKTQVFALARHLGLPDTIINKKSSARLWPEQTTETELGLSFEILDKIIERMNNTRNDSNSTDAEGSKSQIITRLAKDFPSVNQTLIEGIYNLSRLNRHKVTPPSVCRV